MPNTRTKIMGIVNVTPDSFYDGGFHFETRKAIEHGIKLYNEGADILDIGGESSRPFAVPVSAQEELDRVIPVIQALKEAVPIPLSIDTMKPYVAEEALRAGAAMLNDVSGLRDVAMIEVAARYQIPTCVMHMQGTPGNMQADPHYPDGIVDHLLDWMEARAAALQSAGIGKDKVIFDPGIGFGKTVADNLKILHNLQKFKAMGFPLLIGLSRKSFMSKITGRTSGELLPPTIAMNTVAVLANVDIIRVHDVKEHKDALAVLQEYALTGESVKPSV